MQCHEIRSPSRDPTLKNRRRIPDFTAQMTIPQVSHKVERRRVPEPGEEMPGLKRGTKSIRSYSLFNPDLRQVVRLIAWHCITVTFTLPPTSTKNSPYCLVAIPRPFCFLSFMGLFDTAWADSREHWWHSHTDNDDAFIDHAIVSLGSQRSSWCSKCHL